MPELVLVPEKLRAEFHLSIGRRMLAEMGPTQISEKIFDIVNQFNFSTALNMRGETAAFSSFSDAQFDEEAFEAQLTGGRMPTMVCWYWLLKLQARFMSGDYAAAIGAAQKAKALLLWPETNDRRAR